MSPLMRDILPWKDRRPIFPAMGEFVTLDCFCYRSTPWLKTGDRRMHPDASPQSRLGKLDGFQNNLLHLVLGDAAP